MEHKQAFLEKQKQAISCLLTHLYAETNASQQALSENTFPWHERPLLGDLFHAALEHVVSMPQYDYEELLANIITAHMRPGYDEIVLNLRDKNRLSMIRFIVLLNNKRKSPEQGMPLLKISSEITDAAGGCLLKNGADCIDCTLETLLEHAILHQTDTLLQILTT